jgi:FdhE protein
MTIKLPLTIEQIHKATRQLTRQRPTYGAMLAFYESVFVAQEQAKGAIDLEPIILAPDALETHQKEALPLVDIPAFRVDPKAAEGLLSQLCELITTHGTEMAATAQAVSHAIDRREIQRHDLFERLLTGDDLFFQTTSARLGADRNALAFLAYNSIQPSLELCAEQLSRYLDTEAVWRKGYCPVCGSAPGLAVLGEEGRRVLSCSFCRHQWPAPRIFCAFCENTRTGQLHYFYAEEEKDLRVDVCDHCHKYLKTVDAREASRPVFPPLEQVASLHLDIIAAEKGFTGGVDLDLER